MASYNVGVLVRPIPDGAASSEGNEKLRLRLSLVLMPDATSQSKVSPFMADLGKLPTSVRGLTKKLTVRTRYLKRTGGLTSPTTIPTGKVHRVGFAHDEKWEEAAQKVWDAIFADIVNYGGFENALRVLDATQKDWDHLGVVDQRGHALTPRLTIANLKPLEQAIRGIQANADLAYLLAHKRRDRAPWQAAIRGPLDPAFFEEELSSLFAVHRPAVAANQVPMVDASQTADGLQGVLLALTEIAAEERPLAEADTDDAVVLNQAKDLYRASPKGERPRLDDKFMENAQAVDDHLAQGARARLAAAVKRYSALRASTIGSPDGLQRIAEAEQEDGSMSDWWRQMMTRRHVSTPGGKDLGPADVPAPTGDDIFEAMSELIAPQVFRDAADLREEFASQETQHSAKLTRALLVTQYEFAAFRLSLREGLVPDVLTHHKKGKDDTQIEITPREKIQRKLAGIYAYPSLARFLGLIIDMEIDADAIEPHADFPEFGFISVELDDSEASLNAQRTTNWTAYKHFTLADPNGEDAHSIDYFRPLPSDELLDAMAKVKRGRHTYRSLDGLLNLGQQLPTERPRYDLMSLDTAAAARSMEVTGHHIATAQAAGERPNQINTFFTPKRTIGIALIDNARGDEVVETLARAKDLSEQHTAISSQRDVLLFSEDVEIGYRLSIGRRIRNGEKTSWTFRSLHERSLEIEQIPKDYISKRLAFRDTGYIRTGGRVVVKEVNPVIDFAQNEGLLNQALAVWRNWSLAIPVSNPDRPSCGEGELPLTINIDMPHGEPKRQLPALRYGSDYCAVAEIVFQNGSSIGREEAHWLVQTSNHHQAALPAPRSGNWEHATGFRFLRESPIGSPTIHLAEALHQPNNPESNLGEQVRRMVVRTGKIGPKNGEVSRRFAIPPRIEVEVADLHGSFDKLTKMPDGALRHFWINKTGMLPTLTPDGAISFEESERPYSKKYGLGTIVVVNKGPAVDPVQPFFPDPLADRIMAMLDIPETGPGKDGATRSVSFYSVGKGKPTSWPDAFPVLIELKPVQSIAEGEDFKIRIEPRNHDGVSVNALIIEIAPAREMQLTLWCLPSDPSKLNGVHAGVADITRAGGHFVAAAQAALRSQLREKTPEAVSDKWGQISRVVADSIRGLVNGSQNAESVVDQARLRESSTVEDIPVPSICHVELLTLLHAVQKPLRGPTIPPRPVLDPTFGDFKFVRIVNRPTAPVVNRSAAPASSWEKLLTGVNDDLTKLADEFRGTVVYIGGHVDFDRRSTEWIECRGHWIEYDDTKGLLDFSPESQTEFTIEERADRTLFLVGPIPRIYPGGDRLDLLRDSDQALRSLNYDFKDTRARRLSLELIGTSRFSEEFNQPPPKQSQERPGGAISEFQEKTNIATDFWIRSTDHPKGPEILDDETTVSRLSVTDYGFDANLGLDYASRTTRNYLHIRCARPWFSSGEDEMLGLVLWPPTIMTDVPSLMTEGSVLCDPNGDPIVTPGKDKNDPEWQLDQQLEPYISRWGADATRGTLRGMVAFPPMLITPEVFSNSDFELTQPLRMPLPAPPPQANTKASFKDETYRNPDFQYRYVAIMPFKIRPHVETQSWYCDIALHPHHDDQTRVRLSLVRYQAHSLPGLELSIPVAKEVKLLPKRTLKVFLVNDRTVRVQVSGHSYDMKEVRAKDESTARLANVAYMVIELKQLFPDQPIFDEEQPIAGPTVKFTATATSRVYQLPSSKKVPVGEDLRDITKLILSPRFDGATAFWESEDIKLDQPWTSEQYVLLAREIELVAASATKPGKHDNDLELAGLTQRKTYAETLIIRRERPKH